MKKIYLLLAFFIAIFALRAQTVPTQYGSVKGHLNGTIYEFLGISYASPPLDSLRWRPTKSPAHWSNTLLADKFPPECPQKNFQQGQPDSVFTLTGDENCLYLNVWSPDISGNYPVMVFIHGGGNQQGSTSQESAGTKMYDGKNLSDRGDVVVVTIQYRLGALGYLVHPGLEAENSSQISGNYGVMDQIFALKWIQSNIKAFGGNPENVTIFGESAGGVNVGNLLTIPQAKGLFHKAIIESAVPVISNYDTARLEGIQFVDEYTHTGSDSAKIAYMRTVPVDSFSIKNSRPLAGGVVQLHWQPTLDNFLFRGYPSQIIQSGDYNHVPLIIGTNADEMRIAIPTVIMPFMVNSLINKMVPPSLQSTAHLLYPSGNNNEAAKDSYTQILTDAQFTATARRTAQCVSRNQEEPVYRYFFSHTHNPSIPYIGDAKSYHGIELFYVFNTWENVTGAISSWFTPQDDSVQKSMLKYWTNFAYRGDPNEESIPTWPVYDANSDPYLEIKASPDGTQLGLRTDECNLWDSVVMYAGCKSSISTAILNSERSEIEILPNPSDGIFNIQGMEDSNFKIFVFNIAGQSVFSGINQKIIDLSKEEDGVYFVLVIKNGAFYKSKIMKMQ